jgi:hypothetical protein
MLHVVVHHFPHRYGASVPIAALLAALAGAQEDPAPKESWSEWLFIPTHVRGEESADRASVSEGDIVVSANGRKFDGRLSEPLRARDSVVLELDSAGGRRHVAVVAGPAPEPFGTVPQVESLGGGDLLVSRDDRVERIRLVDGTDSWPVRHRWSAQSQCLEVKARFLIPKNAVFEPAKLVVREFETIELPFEIRDIPQR